MPKKQAFIDKSGVKFVENFQKNQKIKKFPSRTKKRYLTVFMQKSQSDLNAVVFLHKITPGKLIFRGLFYVERS